MLPIGLMPSFVLLPIGLMPSFALLPIGLMLSINYIATGSTGKAQIKISAAPD